MLVFFVRPAFSANLDQIIVNDASGSTQLTLNSGDNVMHTGTGAAIDVSVVGSAVRGEGVTVTAGSGAISTIGVRALTGGVVELRGSTVNAFGAFKPSVLAA
ncbi:hypothetical protein [Pseudomonas danubii]|uniref:hypothetical protein n=1 Tax=Pseudomonas danubii TaxID=2497146 RepID=UPI00373FE1E4